VQQLHATTSSSFSLRGGFVGGPSTVHPRHPLLRSFSAPIRLVRVPARRFVTPSGSLLIR
jgi:hypothetical protein